MGPELPGIDRRATCPSTAELLAMARGRWVELLLDAGLPAEALAGDAGRPCPRCGGRDRFAPLPDLADRGAVHCRHCFSSGTPVRPGDGLSTVRWWFGVDSLRARWWLADRLGSGLASYWVGPLEPYRPGVSPEPQRRAEARDDLGPLADRWHAELFRRPRWVARLVELLGLPADGGADALRSLAVGWSADHRATTWPLRGADGAVCGVRLRDPKTGRKWSVRGGREGVFASVDLLDGRPIPRLLVAEGATDAAAALAVGLPAIGRPSCSGARRITRELIERLRPEAVSIVADRDGPGRDGARRLAADLNALGTPVATVEPPEGFADLRDFVAAGADRLAIEQLNRTNTDD